MLFWADLNIYTMSKKRKSPKSPAEQLMAKVIQRVFRPDGSRRRATGLFYPLPFYSKLYDIPLVSIKRIHRDFNPCALDHPAKLLPLLMERPGPKLNLTGMERVVEARFAASLRTGLGSPTGTVVRREKD